MRMSKKLPIWAACMVVIAAMLLPSTGFAKKKSRVIFNAVVAKIVVKVSSADSYDDLNANNNGGDDSYFSNFSGITVELGTASKIQSISVGGLISGGDQLLVTDGTRFKHLNASQAFWFRLFKSVFKEGGDALRVILSSDDSKSGILLDDTLIEKKFKTYLKPAAGSLENVEIPDRGKLLLEDDTVFFTRDGEYFVVNGLIEVDKREVKIGEDFEDVILFLKKE